MDWNITIRNDKGSYHYELHGTQDEALAAAIASLKSQNITQSVSVTIARVDK